MEKNRMVGAISDIQLWCLRPLVELGRPLKLCMVMHVLRKTFTIKLTPRLYVMNVLYKMYHLLQRWDCTTKNELDSS